MTKINFRKALIDLHISPTNMKTDLYTDIILHNGAQTFSFRNKKNRIGVVTKVTCQVFSVYISFWLCRMSEADQFSSLHPGCSLVLLCVIEQQAFDTW